MDDDLGLALQLIETTGAALGIAELARRRIARRREETIQAILREAEVTPRQFVELVLGDFRLEEMVTAAIRASEVTAREEQLPLLRRIVAAGLRDDADVDELHFLEMAALRLGAPHLRVLTSLHFPRAVGSEWHLYPKAGPLLQPILALLESEGLIVQHEVPSLGNPGDIELAWERTKFGQRLMAFLDTPK